MFSYNLLSKPWFSINKKTLDSIFDNISNNVKIPQKWTLNIVFLDDDSIKKLNNNYRKINKTTDVLSFHYFEDFSKIDIDEIAWEIILSESKINENSKEYWLSREMEFYKLIIHSCLHILWFDHEDENDYKIMNKFEKKIWKELFEKNS